MAKSFSRTDRVNDAIHRIVARLIREEVNDPRIGLVTVSAVSVSPDLRNAKIYITVLDGSKIKETLAVLNKAAGFFRSCLANELKLRIIPRPSFVFDESVARGARMESLLGSCFDQP